MALLELRHVTRRFGSLTAVDDVSLTIETGEFFTLLGPSGCGKTTLLRMIAGFDLPDAGSILLDGRDLAGTPPEKRPVHTVFQSYALFPHMTVAGNVAFPLRMAGKSRDDIARLTNKALEDVHLADKANDYPQELSGGQKQRVALARGIVNRPRVLLLDEPLGALDAKLREEMQVELIGLQREVGITFVFVTHAQYEALALSHRIAVMNRGRVEQLDEPAHLYGAPRNRFVANFIGKISLLDCTVLAARPEQLALDVVGIGAVIAPALRSAVPGQKGAYALRPEQVRIGAPDAHAGLSNRHAGTVVDYLYVGDVTTYLVQLDAGARLSAMLPNSAPGRAKFFEPGDRVELAWPAATGSFLAD